MSPDLFPKYLKDTSLLYRISYEELKTLVVQYPYCQNLRYLLLVKSRMDGNMEQERNMKMASAYSQDRTQLYLLLKDDLKEAKKDFEFLDLNHAVSDNNHPELELPILDFSNGIEVEESKKSKKSKKISEELDLFLETNLTDESNDKTFDLTVNEDESSILQKGYETENVSDDLLSLFEDDEEETEEDILAKEALATLATVTTIQKTEEVITDNWESPLIPPSIDFSFAFIEEIQELQIPSALILPLVPPSIDLSFEYVEEVEKVIAEQIPLVLPLVPPSVDLGFTLIELKEEIAIVELIPLILPLVPPNIDLRFTLVKHNEEVAITEQEDLVLPLIPPNIDLAFAQTIAEEVVILEKIAEEVEEKSDLIDEEIDQSIQAALERLANAQKIEAEEEELTKEENIVENITSSQPIVLENTQEESNFGDEIDQSIQAALERLANAQKIELEQEEAEEEARIAGIIKKEMILEGIIKEKEEKVEHEKEVKSSDDEPKTDHEGPMPKASFNSWLKQMAAPTPSLNKKEREQKSIAPKNVLDVPKKKKSKKKKKKKTIIDNEGSRLIKAIKARQEQQRKEETAMMLVRKRKVIELAERSLKENEEIVSETLAKILVIQGKKGKAVHMYRQLMLKFPKKSSFFAAEIEKILK